jgi:hypothetical protein
MSDTVAECLRNLAKQVCGIRTEVLFGDSSDTLDECEGIQAAQVLLAISLLEQAEQHLIIASLWKKG